MVNYLLNHKQGSVTEIQNAIWHFVNLNGTYNPPASTATTAMINDAKTNGGAFKPQGAQTIAVIATPVTTLATENPAQISILEATAANIIANPTKSTPTGTPVAGAPIVIPSYIFLVVAGVVAVVIVGLAIAVRKNRKPK